MGDRNRVEERGLSARIGVERRLEATHEQMEQPGGPQYHRHRDCRGSERDALAAMEKRCHGDHGGSEAARSHGDGRTAQEGPGHGKPNGGLATSMSRWTV